MLNEMIDDKRVSEADPIANRANQIEGDLDYDSDEDLDLLVDDSDLLDYCPEHMEMEECNMVMTMPPKFRAYPLEPKTKS